MDNGLTELLNQIRSKIDCNPTTAVAPARAAISMSENQSDINLAIESMYLLGLSLRETGNPSEAIEQYEKAIELIQEDTPSDIKSNLYSAYSIELALRYQKGDALSYARKAYELKDEVESYHNRIMLYSRVSATYIKLSLYADALDILLKAVSILKKDVNFKDEGYIYSHLCVVQSRIKNYDEAQEWSIKAENSFTQIGNTRGILSSLINRSLSQYYQENIEDCIVTLKKAKKICLAEKKEANVPIQLVYTNLGFAYSHEKIGDYQKGIENALSSYELVYRSKMTNLICLNLACILNCLSHSKGIIPDIIKKDYPDLESILFGSIELANIVNDPLVYKEVYESAVTYYLSQNNFKEAFYKQKKLEEINQMISNKEKDENLFALNIKYETYQKEIKLQQLELEQRELKIKQKEKLKEVNKSLENKVKERTSELMAKNHELQQYAYIVAHDIKEPIRSIVGFAQLLERRALKELSDESKELLNYIVDSSINMREMIDGLLQYSTIQIKRHEFQKINTQALFEKVFLSLRNNIKENNAKIIIGKTPEFIYGDNVRIRQLFQNLIANAIKFKHPDRAPIIKIKGYKTKEGFSFSVKDNGIGIKKDFHEQIFLLFRRLHTKNTFKGSGIGLSVCHKIVSLHGGKIWLHSEENKGSTFHFTLP